MNEERKASKKKEGRKTAKNEERRKEEKKEEKQEGRKHEEKVIREGGRKKRRRKTWQKTGQRDNNITDFYAQSAMMAISVTTKYNDKKMALEHIPKTAGRKKGRTR